MQKKAVHLIVAGLFTVSLSLGALAQTPSPEASKRSYKPLPPPKNFSPPVLHCAEPNHDWGKVLQGELVTHDYVIKNNGGSPLAISQVKASCGCTVATKPEKPIPPGQSDVVTLKIDTKRFSGKVRKTGSIYSNSLPSPFTISIGGIVESFYTLDPKTPRLTRVRGVAGEPLTVTLKKNAATDVKFDVKEITTQDKVVKAKISEVKPGEVYELELDADLPDDRRKYYYEPVALTLEVNGREVKQTFNVSVSVQERVAVQPRTSVYFSRNETKALKEPNAGPLTKSVDIVSLGGPDHTFEITEITASPTTPITRQKNAAPVEQPDHYFQTKLETVEEGKHYRLSVTMPSMPSVELRTVRERIVIKTSDSEVGQLALTAMAAIQ